MHTIPLTILVTGTAYYITRFYLMLDGRISEDSAVDLGDVITDEDEIIEELIKRGMCIPTAYLVITQKAGIYAPFVQNDKSCIGC